MITRADTDIMIITAVAVSKSKQNIHVKYAVDDFVKKIYYLCQVYMFRIKFKSICLFPIYVVFQNH